MSEDKSASNIKKVVFSNDSEKAIGRGKIGRRLERFDPNAIDGDNDGMVQEGTAFERPAGPQNMPQIKPIKVPRREEVPLPNRQPSKPSTPAPSKPSVPEKPAVPSKRSLAGNIGSEDFNTFRPDDDDDLVNELFSPDELDELLKSQDEALDELAESISGSYDLEEELRAIIDRANNLPDPNEIFSRLKNGEASREEFDNWTDDDGVLKIPKEYADAGWEYDEQTDSLISPQLAREITQNIQKWLENHPFNRNARNYEEREWADNEYDGQAERYAPTPTEIRDGLEIDWDNLAKIAGFTSEQKDDWELSEEELKDREEAAAERLGSSAAATAERAKVWKRVQDGEGFREIAPDYPDVHWSTVREMSRQGAMEAGASKQKSQAAENAAREKSRQRANQAAVKQLLEKMKSSTSPRSLRNNLQNEIERIKEQRKRASNEYQMIRKAQVEKWRLASLLYDTIPSKTEGEKDIDFAKRMMKWFDESADFFEKLAQEINNNHDISTATNRAYDFYRDQVNLMQSKLNDIDSFWDEVKEYKKGGGSSGGLAGSMSSEALPRGVRIASDAKANPIDSREFDAIRKDMEKISKGSFSKASKAKRPQGLSSRENSIYSVVKNAKDFSPRKKRRKPKKA
jgi:hypothetical protein